VLQVVLQPIGSLKFDGPRHFARSMERGYRVADVEPLVPSSAVHLVREAVDDRGVVRFWGSQDHNKSIFDKIELGDWAFFYGERVVHHVGVVSGKFSSEALAIDAWDDGSFRHIYLVTGVRRTDIPYDVIASPLGYSTAPGTGIRRLTLLEPFRSRSLLAATATELGGHVIFDGGSDPSSAAIAVTIPLERGNIASYVRHIEEHESEASRREQELVVRYRDH
jgi:hypothetical protein